VAPVQGDAVVVGDAPIVGISERHRSN